MSRDKCTQQNLFQRQSSLFAAGREQLMEGKRISFKMEERDGVAKVAVAIGKEAGL